MHYRNYYLIILFGYFTTVQAQVNPNSLLKIPSLSTTDITTTLNVKEGSIVFDTDQKKLFQYDGTSWRELLTTPPKVTPKTSNYTLTAADNYSILTFNSATDVVLTIPAGLIIGFNVSVYQIGVGEVTIIGVGSVVKNRLSRFKTAGLDAGVGIVSTATNIYHITGDLKR